MAKWHTASNGPQVDAFFTNEQSQNRPDCMIRTATPTAEPQTGPRHRRSCTRVICVALMMLLLWTPVVGAKAFDEAAIKAVFLFRLALFVTWPEPMSLSADTPFVIGILGADPFEDRLDMVVQGERIGPQNIAVRRYTALEEIEADPCQLLYVGDVTPAARIRVNSLALRHKILTVSDTPGFAQEGGMMAIETVAKRLRITINLAATRQAGFSISAKLLKIAQLISNKTS